MLKRIIFLCVAFCFVLMSMASFAGDVRNPSPDIPTLNRMQNSLLHIEIINYSMVCKLINERFNDDPTANDLQHRFNLKGTDFGISAASREQVWFFFGDTMAFKDSWKPGSGPDFSRLCGCSCGKACRKPGTFMRTLEFSAGQISGRA